MEVLISLFFILGTFALAIGSEFIDVGAMIPEKVISIGIPIVMIFIAVRLVSKP